MDAQILIFAVQCLVLQAIYQELRRKFDGAWKYHCLAVKAAMSIGLHSVDTSLSPSIEAEMSKRVWYCCVVLDG